MGQRHGIREGALERVKHGHFLVFIEVSFKIFIFLSLSLCRSVCTLVYVSIVSPEARK